MLGMDKFTSTLPIRMITARLGFRPYHAILGAFEQGLDTQKGIRIVTPILKMQHRFKFYCFLTLTKIHHRELQFLAVSYDKVVSNIKTPFRQRIGGTVPP